MLSESRNEDKHKGERQGKAEGERERGVRWTGTEMSRRAIAFAAAVVKALARLELGELGVGVGLGRRWRECCSLSK